jgi:hypothetical protein
MKYQIELINIGREKVNERFELEGNNFKEISIMLYARLKRHLMSREISISEEENAEGKYYVYAGFHKVGEIKLTEIKTSVFPKGSRGF